MQSISPKEQALSFQLLSIKDHPHNLCSGAMTAPLNKLFLNLPVWYKKTKALWPNPEDSVV